MSLSVLVAIEMFNALNALSEDGSLLTVRGPVRMVALTALLLHIPMKRANTLCTVPDLTPPAL